MFKGKNGKPPLFFIYLTIFVNLIGFGMVFPLIPYYGREFNASALMIGIIMSSFAVGQFVFSPFWGRLSDRYGRKPIIAIALIGLSISFLGFAIAKDLPWLFISRFLQGVFSAAALPVAQAYVADVTTKEERVVGMGRLGASLSLGFIFGPAIGSALSIVDHAFPFYAASAVALLNFASVQLFLPESLTKKSEKVALKAGFLNFKSMYHALKGELGMLFILLFLWSYALSNNQVAVPLLGYEHLHLSAAMIGIFFSGVGIGSSLVQLFVVQRVALLIGDHQTAYLGLGIMAFSLLLMPFSGHYLMMGLAMVIVSIGSGLARPTINALISNSAKDGQGTTMGVATAFESFGRILGPLLGGALFSISYFVPFVLCSVSVFLALSFVIKKHNFLKAEQLA